MEREDEETQMKTCSRIVIDYKQQVINLQNLARHCVTNHADM